MAKGRSKRFGISLAARLIFGKDDMGTKVRVGTALALLVGSKVFPPCPD